MDRKTRLAGSELAKEQTETAHGETDAHQREPGSNPGQKRSLGRKINPWIALCRLFHMRAVITSSLAKRDVDIVPNQPVLVEIFRAMPRIKAPCNRIRWIDIDADAERILRCEPLRQQLKQL